MAKGSMSRIRLWKKMTGILYVLGGLSVIGVALYIWLVVFPGDMTLSGRPYMVLYAGSFVGGAAAIIIGIWTLSLKIPEMPAAQPESEGPETWKVLEDVPAAQPAPAKKYRLRCKSCGEIFTVPEIGGIIKCPHCGMEGKLTQ